MLQQIREKTQGIISKILVGLLIAVFALWGVDTIVGNFLVSTVTKSCRRKSTAYPSRRLRK